jgi:hypothetical protein
MYPRTWTLTEQISILFAMNAMFKQESLHRAGKEFRVNPSRFFFVKTMGWFVYMRGDFVLNHGLISQDGVAGPFLSKNSATKFVVHEVLGSF